MMAFMGAMNTLYDMAPRAFDIQGQRDRSRENQNQSHEPEFRTPRHSSDHDRNDNVFVFGRGAASSNRGRGRFPNNRGSNRTPGTPAGHHTANNRSSDRHSSVDSSDNRNSDGEPAPKRGKHYKRNRRMKELAKEQRDKLRALLDEKKAWEDPQGASTPSRRSSGDQTMDSEHPSPIRAPTPSPPPTPAPKPQRESMRRKDIKTRLGVESNVRDRIDESRRSHPSGDSGVSESSYMEPDRYNSCSDLVPLSVKNRVRSPDFMNTSSYSVAEEGKIVDVTNDMETETPPPLLLKISLGPNLANLLLLLQRNL